MSENPLFVSWVVLVKSSVHKVWCLCSVEGLLQEGEGSAGRGVPG